MKNIKKKVKDFYERNKKIIIGSAVGVGVCTASFVVGRKIGMNKVYKNCPEGMYPCYLGGVPYRTLCDAVDRNGGPFFARGYTLDPNEDSITKDRMHELVEELFEQDPRSNKIYTDVMMIGPEEKED